MSCWWSIVPDWMWCRVAGWERETAAAVINQFNRGRKEVVGRAQHGRGCGSEEVGSGGGGKRGRGRGEGRAGTDKGRSCL